MSITGDRIKQRRLALGISQLELAEKLGYKSDVSISKIESGAQDCPKGKLRQMADALYTTPGWLAGWDQEIDDDILNGNEKYLEILHKDPQYKVLLDSTSKLDERSLKKLIDFIKTLSE